MADGSFRVRPESLLEFARELEAQLDALQRPAERLAALGGRPLPLGQFAQAHALGQRHESVATQMRDVLAGVRDAVAFAEEVTRAVAGAYGRQDEEIAASYRSLGTVYGSSLSRDG